MNRLILEEILEGEFCLESAASGEEALQKVVAFRPDLIILDNMMPGIDGYETTRRLRADRRFRFTKIILVSAKALVKERLDGYHSGADDYVTKPFDADELLAKARVFARFGSLEEVDQLRSDILGLFSHEIRTPLSGILGPSELLLDPEIADDPEQRNALIHVIHESSLRIHQYFERLHLLFELRSSSNPLCVEEISAMKMIEDVVAEWQQSADDSGIRIEVRADPALSVWGDRSHLVLAAGVLVDNAIRFSPDGGVVSIAVQQSADEIVISVVDRGPGVDAELRSAILDGGVVRDLQNHQQGTGVSIAVAHQVARKHGGSLDLESTMGVGSCFRLHLPVEPTRIAEQQA